MTASPMQALLMGPFVMAGLSNGSRSIAADPAQVSDLVSDIVGSAEGESCTHTCPQLPCPKPCVNACLRRDNYPEKINMR